MRETPRLGEASGHDEALPRVPPRRGVAGFMTPENGTLRHVWRAATAVWLCRTGRSVGIRAFDAIDHQDLDGRLGVFDLQPELIGKGRLKRGARLRAGSQFD